MKINQIIISLLVLALIAGLSFYLFNKNGKFETYTVERKNFEEVIEISGKVIPAQEIELSFENSGKIKKINVDTGDIVKEGDILVELNSDEVEAELNEKVTSLEVEEARLSEISGNSNFQNKLELQEKNLLKIIKKSYVNADDIVKSVVDTFFDNPNKRFPEFSSSLSDYFIRQDIENYRIQVGENLKEWKILIDEIDSTQINDGIVEKTISNLEYIEEMLALISANVDEFEETGGVTQIQIDSYIANISSSRNLISNLIVEVNNAVDSLRSVKAEIPVLEASIDNASASVNRLSAKIDKFILRAPFDGIITEQKIELGKIVSANETVISMISDKQLEIEAFVPEINIAGVDLDDLVTMTFDAFGDGNLFEGFVSHIDPRETIKDGITTYKILLNFKQEYSEIRSGMTNDVKIIKTKIEDAIVIPTYLIKSDSDGNFVEVYDESTKEKRNIKIGRKDGRGNTQILSGLDEGEMIVIPK